MKKLIELIIKKLKKDPNYSLDNNYSLREILTISRIRFVQIMRGFKKKLTIGESKGLIFCGRRATIEFAYLIKCGTNLVLEDNVILNALSKGGIILGDNVTIAKNSVLQCTGVIAKKGKGIKIGNNSAVGANSYFGGQGGIEIGNDVIMGPNVKIFSENHIFNISDIPIRRQGENRKGVKINDNCWVGAGSTILDGVEIGEGCVIAAGSVVTKSFKSNLIIGGVPAKVIKGRFE